jgi:uncharacterized membrane protein
MNVEAAVKALKHAMEFLHSTDDDRVTAFIRIEEDGATTWSICVFDENSEPLFNFSGSQSLDETLRNALINVLEKVKPKAKQLNEVVLELDNVINPVELAR